MLPLNRKNRPAVTSYDRSESLPSNPASSGRTFVQSLLTVSEGLTMKSDDHLPLTRFLLLKRTSASAPQLVDLKVEIHQALSALRLPKDKFQGRRIAVSVGSRGIANLKEIVRATCDWLRAHGAEPFVFPAMGSHGGATADGQRGILEEYGINEGEVGAEVRSSMETVHVGDTAEGFSVFMDRSAWEADGVLVMNRIKPHTDFSGTIQSGLLKMMAVGMGKVGGAVQTHRWGWKYGFERVIRSMSSVVLASGKILCGLAAIENELHQVCRVRASRPEDIPSHEEANLEMARSLTPRIPFSKLHLLIVDELGKNISGTGMDTKVIGRGVKTLPGESPEIDLIYVRDLSPESDGNALGIGLADLMHERVFRKIDLEKTHVNARVQMFPLMARLPLFLPSDRDALDLALGHLGQPDTQQQRIVWIRNTLDMDRIGVSEPLLSDAKELDAWRPCPNPIVPEFDDQRNLVSPL